MVEHSDALYNRILVVINKADEPLETREIEELLPKHTRTMILYRLYNLRGDGLVKGKQVGSGKGAWIWWSSKE